ncbi:unnamed protein product [Oikopleura dioica]|uniref:Uncharacterized protein n=1 Tax=Oikopleura dioica TaxID=34765 RepID=E4YDR1_OIKDI|nr:unnamed protein product [Oikopleura dioica]
MGSFANTQSVIKAKTWRLIPSRWKNFAENIKQKMKRKQTRNLKKNRKETIFTEIQMETLGCFSTQYLIISQKKSVALISQANSTQDAGV